MSAAQEERRRVEDFLTAFNTIEAQLKRETGVDSFESFRTAVHRYSERHRGWPDFKAVMAFADLRNVIVHDRYERYAYLSVPSRQVVTEIQEVRDRLLSPITALQQFRRDEVVALDLTAPVLELLQLIDERDFTHIPVFAGERFHGLVTSNGVARWLAEKVQELSVIEFADHTVGEFVDREEERPNWVFVAAQMAVDDVVFLFQDNPTLEAALVTQNGREHESLLGIGTRWDIASLKGD